MKKIAILDCATRSPSLLCFLRLKKLFPEHFSYHAPSQFGCKTLRKDSPDLWIIFGSYSNVCDRLPWQQELATFMKDQIEKGIPTLGICFGHQLMADAFGGSIDLVDKKKTHRVGKRSFKVLKDERGFQKGETYSVFVSHKFEIKKLPSSFEVLGESKECPYDLVAHKDLPYIGIQGHPESSRHFIMQEIDKIKEKDLLDSQEGGHQFLKTILYKAFP